MIRKESSTNSDASKHFLKSLGLDVWLSMTIHVQKVDHHITQNGYIPAKWDFVGFVARSLLYKTLYTAIETRRQNSA